MKLKILVTSSVLSALLIFSSYTLYFDEGDKAGVLIRLMMQGMNYYHYQPQQLDDNFSRKAFNQYMKRLDYNKRFFTARDIENLQRFEDKIDDEVDAGTFELFELSFNLYNKRVADAETFCAEILAEPFDFEKDEVLETDVEPMPYAKNEAELKDRWRKSLKYQTLTRLVDMLDRQEKAQTEGDTETEILSFEAMEEKARKKVLDNNEKYFKRLVKEKKADRRTSYINSIINIFDPHTSYFPPKDKENFDIAISGRLEGIGAQLRESEGSIKVVNIVPGSASYRQGELKVNDLILKVAQGKEEPVDVTDMDLDDAVRLIRGKKGTEVRLTVKKIDGTTKQIPIIRDIVELQETYAKSAILKDGNSRRSYGYIHLPKFYVDFNRRNGRRCATDVAKEIEKLKDENVKGIILDLRGNGGGSLPDVVEMAGLFIPKGPIVQVKSREGAPRVLADRDPKVNYDGPLVIMVNSFSASASEIMAAAMQDYGRAIIIGSPATFGKGTVQRFVDLDNLVRGSHEIKPLGDVKLTTQKFYRINGGATQLKGVVPDIIIPDEYSLLDIGEKDEDYSMEWDEISPVDYEKWNQDISGDIDRLRKNSKLRINQHSVFQLVNENAQRLKRQQDKKIYPLNFDSYRQERDRLNSEAEKYKDIEQVIADLKISSLKADISEIESDSIRIKRRDQWHEDLQKDAYVYEALSVLKDINK